MACNEQITNLLSIDFSNTNDVGNWFTTSTIPIEMEGDKLKLKSNNSSAFFRRTIGVLDGTKNRVRLKSNLEVFRPQTSTDGEICVKFEMLANNVSIGDFTLYEDNLTNGERVSFNFDRVFKYSGSIGNLVLRITIEQGIGNELLLSDLSVDNQVFCADNVRTYFALDDVFIQSFNAMQVGFRMREYKVNNVETLTTAFFNETSNIGGPKSGWFFARANQDGTNRVENLPNANTFNFFERDCRLTFATTAGNYHGGKPTGTQTGSDYGTGILNIGYDKPEVLNRALVNQKGAFFIDINYTQNLRVSFDVVVNMQSTSLFDSPSIYRRYFVEVDTTSCSQKFYYLDLLQNSMRIDQETNGFLSGLTGGQSSQEFVTCGQVLSYSGRGGTTEFNIDLGSNIGNAGIDYKTEGVPANFQIEWNGQTFQTMYVGPNNLNQELLNSGVQPAEINTANPSNGIGNLRFNKNTATPSTAVIRVLSPLDNTNWEITTVCPPTSGGAPRAQIGEGSCSLEPGSENVQNIFVNTTNITQYTPSNGDVLYSDPGLTTPFNGQGRGYRFRVDANSIWKQVQFNVSNTGVVSTATACQVGGMDIVTENVDISNCQTIWVVTVQVPTSATRRVQITSQFQGVAEYSEINNITSSIINVPNNIDETITSSKTYVFGIDGDNTQIGSILSNSIINIQVTDPGNSGALVAVQTFGRLHSGTRCMQITF